MSFQSHQSYLIVAHSRVLHRNVFKYDISLSFLCLHNRTIKSSKLKTIFYNYPNKHYIAYVSVFLFLLVYFVWKQIIQPNALSAQTFQKRK